MGRGDASQNALPDRVEGCRMDDDATMPMMARRRNPESGSDPELGRHSGPGCVECGAGPVVIRFGDEDLCDRCFDVRISADTGWPRLPEPPPPETIAGPDGRPHRVSYRIWRSPGGIVAEALEGDRSAERYFAKVVGPHDADVVELVQQVKAAIRRRIARQDLTLSPSGNMIVAGDDLVGRLVWQGQDRPYGVVVDGIEMTWDEFGLAMEPFEGWDFRISFAEGVVDPEGAAIDKPGEVEYPEGVAPDAPGEGDSVDRPPLPTWLPAPDERVH
jgi:hypothetical protein